MYFMWITARSQPTYLAVCKKFQHICSMLSEHRSHTPQPTEPLEGDDGFEKKPGVFTALGHILLATIAAGKGAQVHSHKAGSPIVSQAGRQ